jgi:hypothetical protein
LEGFTGQVLSNLAMTGLYGGVVEMALKISDMVKRNQMQEKAWLCRLPGGIGGKIARV